MMIYIILLTIEYSWLPYIPMSSLHQEMKVPKKAQTQTRDTYMDTIGHDNTPISKIIGHEHVEDMLFFYIIKFVTKY